MDPQSLLSTIALAVSVLALLIGLLAHQKLSSTRRALSILQGTFDGKTLIDAVASYVKDVQSIEEDLLAVARRQEELFATLGRSTRNLGVIRYDAFEDMGGKMSFSAALLDDHANGVVITSINARAESRVYAKVIAGGRSEHNLSDDEQLAITEALGAKQRVRR